MHFLLVEDAPEIIELIDVALKMRWPDSRVTAVERGGMAPGVIAAETPDLLILDLGLPDMDGLDLLERIRRASEVPVIILTSRGHEVARIKGLEAGADDYIVKPFSSTELLARVRAVLRRAEKSSPAQKVGAVVSGNLEVDFAGEQASIGGKAVPFSRLEWNVLSFMAQYPDRVMAHDELKERAWGSTIVDDSVVKMCIRRIRRKLKAAGGDPEVVATHRGAGYRFKA